MHTHSKEKTLQHPNTQSQSKIRLQCSNNKDECKQSDCIKAHKNTLLNFCIVQESGTYFFTIRPQDGNVALNLMADNILITLARHGRLYRAMHPKL